jgi:lipopolysaccharide transport system ATP-binding protein
MNDIAIKVDNLGKKFLIGHQREPYVALNDVVTRSVKRFGANLIDVLRGRQIVSGNEVEEFWALKGVSFDVNSGEVVGVVGRNGAGKSTLLKILSRITEPTEGRVTIKGRVASLLEVGTGFHQELSGRENIYLNGGILGMSRAEISRKFDEIVAFAEVERFLDTPVKRYSSGMYVRLAFAVAAHLDPEILIVDEVLAVGDAQFQKKCLGKMADIGRDGRTILFVSHNMAMISSLCQKAVLLQDGHIRAAGPAADVILGYVGGSDHSPAALNYRGSTTRAGDRYARLLSADIRNQLDVKVSEVRIDQSFSVRMEFEIAEETSFKFVPNFHFYGSDGTCAFVTSAPQDEYLRTGEYAAECQIPANFMNSGIYSVRLALSSFESGVIVHINEKDGLMFSVLDPIDGIVTRGRYTGAIPGAVRPELPWEISTLKLLENA